MGFMDHIRKKLGTALGSNVLANEMIEHVSEVSLVVPVTGESADVEVGDGAVTFRMPFAMTITEVRASVSTAPVGSTIIVDVTKNGTSVLSTLLSVDAGEKTSATAASRAVVNASGVCADDDEISINVDQVGSSTAGAGLKVTLKGLR